MGSYPAACAGFHHRSRRAAHDRRELCLPGKPAGRGSGGRLAVACQAGKIAATQSGHGRRRQAPDGRAARRVLGVALTATDYRQLFRLGERAVCRVRRESTVLRQNAAVTQPLPINCGGSTPISAGIQVLTYISIGFLSDIIYAAGIARVDHNMLSIRGTWAHDRLQTPTGWRVLPTVAPFVLSPQSVGIMASA